MNSQSYNGSTSQQINVKRVYGQYTSCSTTGCTGFPSTHYGVAGRVNSKFYGKKQQTNVSINVHTQNINCSLITTVILLSALTGYYEVCYLFISIQQTFNAKCVCSNHSTKFRLSLGCDQRNFSIFGLLCGPFRLTLIWEQQLFNT